MTVRPHELAEQSALAIVLEAPHTAARVFGRVPVADWSPRNGLVAEAIHGLRVARKPVDVRLVAAEMERRGTLNRAGGLAYLHEIVTQFTTPAHVDSYLDVIVTETRRRRVLQGGARAVDLAREGSTEDPVAVARAAAAHFQGIADAADTDSGDAPVASLREFLDHDEDPYDWVTPGLLERGDRMILTGLEGLGKSVLLAQLAVTVAAGVHPFTGVPTEPQRVLVIDCENGPRQLRRRLRGLAAVARQHTRHGADDTLFVEAVPAGLDLTGPTDEAWLVRAVTAVQPALLITGSLYRLHAKNPNEEEPARAITRVIDRCRSAADCAVILEAHAGHSDGRSADRPVRPTGSSLWLRWPEFGYGMRPTSDYTPDTRVVDFVPWRGDRDERNWPKRLRAGSSAGHPWPWATATYDAHNDVAWGAA